jgi:hypothetical protein
MDTPHAMLCDFLAVNCRLPTFLNSLLFRATMPLFVVLADHTRGMGALCEMRY